PKRLRNPRVLGVVRRTLDLDESFRKAVDERVLDEEEALARLLRAGRHAEALASGETPEAVARGGRGPGRGGGGGGRGGGRGGRAARGQGRGGRGALGPGRGRERAGPGQGAGRGRGRRGQGGGGGGAGGRGGGGR